VKMNNRKVRINHSYRPISALLLEPYILLIKGWLQMMLKAFVISVFTLGASLSFANQWFSDTAIKALEAQNQFISDYNTNTIKGFSEIKDIAALAAEVESQFLNDYVTKSVHGFSVTPNSPIEEVQVQYRKILLTNENLVSCTNGINRLSLVSCLAALRENEFINNYVAGQLR